MAHITLRALIVDRLGRAALVAAAMSAALGAFSPNAAEAKPEKGKTFDDWTIACEPVPNGKEEKCYAQQVQAVQDGSRLITVAMGYLGAKGEAVAVVTLPLGINLQMNPAFKIDGHDQVMFKLAQCTSNGCQGSLPLDAKVLDQLKGGKSMVFGVMPFGSDKTLTLPVSLKGFAAAFASLK